MLFPKILSHTEALIFASDKALTISELTELINTALSPEEKATPELLQNAIDAIAEKYDSELFPFGLKLSGGGYQFLTKAAYYKTVVLLNGDKYLRKLSAAALETLAIIAYRQPVTKGEMENIRGVNCDYAVQKLLEKELVIITGRRENAPGQPIIYATSRHFTDYFGINSTGDLPKLNDLFPENTAATTVTGANPVEQDITGNLPEHTHIRINENADVLEVKPGGE